MFLRFSITTGADITLVTCFDRSAAIPVARRGDRETLRRSRATETEEQRTQNDDVERIQRANARNARTEKLASLIEVNDLYRFPDGTCRPVSKVERSDDGLTWTEV